jgi:hypothetical protein
MLWIEEPGGVVAGVLGRERPLLLRLVSIEMGFDPCPLLMPCWFQGKLSGPLILPITAEAGGVGNEWPRSIDGRPIDPG